MLELNRNEWEPEEWEKINRKVTQRLTGWDEKERLEEHFLFGSATPDEYRGFRKPVLEKIGRMVAFFSKTVAPFTTKMNKLLFYADFLHYSKKGYGISGLSYIAIDYGPVPKK